jgi:hypothetical protein
MRRTARVLAALALAAILPACEESVSVFSGIVLDGVAPTSPGTSVLPTFTGTTAPGATVEIHIDPSGAGSPVAVGTADQSGGFSILVSVPNPSFRTYYAFADPPRGSRLGPSNGLLYACRQGGFQASALVLTLAAMTHVATADFDEDGILDAVVNDPVNNQALHLPGIGTGAFDAGVPLATGGGTPAGMVAADFNGDQHADLAFANFGTATVGISLGNGLGAFAPPVPVAVGANPYALLATDFDGDLDLDLAVANYGAFTVSILLNDGAGVFAPAAGSPIALGAASPIGLSAGNFNGGGTDLVVWTDDAVALPVLLGNGSGGFTLQPGPVLQGGHHAAVLDLNGTGGDDVVATESLQDRVVLLTSTAVGGFTASANGPLTTGDQAFHTSAADFDTDGLLDLLVSDFGGNTLSFFKGLGAGAFAARVPVTAASSPWFQAVADLNNDGLPDVLVVCGTSLRVLIGK